MNKELFRNWLKTFKKLENTTCSTRTSNCNRIERYYGDLDEIYDEDQCERLLEEFTYTRADEKLGNKQKHTIPIEGNVFSETRTLKGALKLYIEFKKNILIENAKVAEDIEADKHDGSYELVRETVRSLKSVPKRDIDIEDLDLLYSMAIGTWRSGVEAKRQKIQNSHLDENEKERLNNILEKVKEKAINNEYKNHEGNSYSIGMFGTGFHTFSSKSDKESAEKFISLCIRISDMEENQALSETEKVINTGIKGMQSAAASAMLHCLRPEVFPIINQSIMDTVVLFEQEGIKLIKPRDLKHYIYNTRLLKKFRDDKCSFKNYRALDLILAMFNRKKDYDELIEDDENMVKEVSDIEGTNEYENYWFLNAKPSIWSFDELDIGQQIEYTSINDNGNKRRIYRNFEEAKKGEIVVGYESTPVKSVVAICKVVREHDGETIAFEKVRNLIEPIEYEVLKEVEGLQNMEFFKNNKGSLFKLTKEEYDEIMNLIDEETIEKREEVKEYSKENFLNEVFISEQQYDEICILLKRKKNIILQGAPGVGKTFAAKRLAYSIMNKVDDSRIEMIQFHQNYSYEDFIMGYRPTSDGGFDLRFGVFYKFCKKASNDPNNDYFFIIDEINRGNLSKIFGELMLLIEKDKRGRDYAVTLTYMNDGKFYVPKNVHIIGMMNTADRSLAMLDYALRRRFSFIEIEPAFSRKAFRNHLLEEGINEETIDIIIERLTYLNSKIEEDPNLGKGFRIGHSYFCDCEADENWYESVIQYEIKPLIEEYWYDDEEKVNEYIDYLLG